MLDFIETNNEGFYMVVFEGIALGEAFYMYQAINMLDSYLKSLKKV